MGYSLEYAACHFHTVNLLKIITRDAREHESDGITSRMYCIFQLKLTPVLPNEFHNSRESGYKLTQKRDGHIQYQGPTAGKTSG